MTKRDNRAYNSWGNMIQRCTNPKNTGYPYYGGRGITVCDRWRSFDNFLADMGNPNPGQSLDRRENDGNYEPGNVRWADKVTQSLNRGVRKDNISGYTGVSYSQGKWHVRYRGMSKGTFNTKEEAIEARKRLEAWNRLLMHAPTFI